MTCRQLGKQTAEVAAPAATDSMGRVASLPTPGNVYSAAASASVSASASAKTRVANFAAFNNQHELKGRHRRGSEPILQRSNTVNF
jgi:hypothetical protein